jgi:hypothetical protein
VRVDDIDSARASDHLQYAVDILANIVIPEADHTPAAGFEPSRTPTISSFRRRVLAPIELDDQGVIGADKIGDERTERNLPTELQTG